jgi:hypothetical protein
VPKQRGYKLNTNQTNVIFVVPSTSFHVVLGSPQRVLCVSRDPGMLHHEQGSINNANIVSCQPEHLIVAKHPFSISPSLVINGCHYFSCAMPTVWYINGSIILKKSTKSKQQHTSLCQTTFIASFSFLPPIFIERNS